MLLDISMLMPLPRGASPRDEQSAKYSRVEGYLSYAQAAAPATRCGAETILYFHAAFSLRAAHGS